jgi:hypothetical protein
MVTICKNCKFYYTTKFPLPPVHFCSNNETPITNFISGYRMCEDININGKCLCYQWNEKGVVK